MLAYRRVALEDYFVIFPQSKKWSTQTLGADSNGLCTVDVPHTAGINEPTSPNKKHETNKEDEINRKSRFDCPTFTRTHNALYRAGIDGSPSTKMSMHFTVRAREPSSIHNK